MKHITLGEINKFQCIGSKCLYTCCAGNWDIVVDKKTDQYYQSVQGVFGEELREKIHRTETAAAMKLTSTGRCPFLNEDNLCRIYIELGPEHLCDTCREYPRIVSIMGDRVLHYLTISCPKVGRDFLSRKTPLDVHIIDDSRLPVRLSVQSPDWSFFRLAERAFQVNLEILQTRSHTIPQREQVLLLFNRAFQDAVDAKRWNEAETLITFFSSPANYQSLTQNKVIGHVSSKVRFLRELSDVMLTRMIEKTVNQMFAIGVQYICSKDADIDSFSSYLETFNGKEFQREQENLLTYFLFHNYLSNSLLNQKGERDLFRRIVFVLVLFQFYRIFSAIFSTNERQVISLEKRVLMLAHMSRHFEHSLAKFRDSFNQELEKHQFYDMGFLFQLIS